MHKELIQACKKTYDELVEYINYLEDLGATCDDNFDPSWLTQWPKESDDLVQWFNGWTLERKEGYPRSVYLADMMSELTREPKIEVYCYKKYQNDIDEKWYLEEIRIKDEDSRYGYHYKSVICQDFKTFKKAIDKTMKLYRECQMLNNAVELKKAKI